MIASRVWLSNSAKAAGTIAVLTACLAAQANVGLFNTGVDSSNAVLALGTVDTHYTVSPGSQTFAVTNAEGYPGYWLGPNATSEWITPLLGAGNTGSGGAAAGNYVYSTSFDLSGINLATAFIQGLVTADNGITDILINGHSTGFTYGGPGSSVYTSFASFTIGSGFQSGINTLTFDVVNGGGPTGLRTEFTGSNFSVAAVPEPQTWVMLLAGLTTIGVMFRRRSVVRV